jgi:hypothetical protein
MKKLDRIFLIALVIGVWGLIGTMWLRPSNVDAHADGHTHDSYDVYGIAKKGHTHDSYEVYGVAKKGHTHTCYVDGDTANCM